MAATLMDSVRNYLIAQGLVRLPRDATDKTLPPLWSDPKLGIPAPGQTQDLAPEESAVDPSGNPTPVLAMFKVTGIPQKPFEGFIRQDNIEFWIRTVRAPDAYAIEARLREFLNDKRNWQPDGFYVNQSIMFRDLQRIGSDQEGFVFNTEYLFDVWSDPRT